MKIANDILSRAEEDVASRASKEKTSYTDDAVLSVAKQLVKKEQLDNGDAIIKIITDKIEKEHQKK